MKILEFIEYRELHNFYDYMSSIGYSDEKWEKNIKLLMQWHLKGDLDVITKLSSDSKFRELMTFKMFMDIFNIRHSSYKKVNKNRLTKFTNTSIDIFRGGSGEYEDRDGISSYSFNKGTAETYMHYNATKSIDSNILSMNLGPGWLIGGSVRVTDIILYTNLQHENEVIINNKHINDINVLTQTD